LLVHFISDQESGRVFNRLSNRTHRQVVALTTVILILNISNPSTFCPILNNSEHSTVTFSPLSVPGTAGRGAEEHKQPATINRPRGQHANGGGGGQGTQAACAMDLAAVSARRRRARGLDQALRRPRGCTAPLSPVGRRGDAAAWRPRWRGRRRRRRRGRRLPRAPSAVSFTAGWGGVGCGGPPRPRVDARRLPSQAHS